MMFIKLGCGVKNLKVDPQISGVNLNVREVFISEILRATCGIRIHDLRFTKASLYQLS